MRSSRALLASTVVLAACVGSDPDGANPTITGGDAGSDASVAANDAGGDAGNGGVTDAAADAPGSFCSTRAAAVCEDFEGVFPPGGWQQDKTNASWEAALGFESARGFASFHDAVATDAQALLYRDVTVSAADKTVRMGARVRRVTFAAPESFTSVFYLRTNDVPERFVTFAMTSSTTASLVADAAGSFTFVSVPSAFAAGWHSVVVEITRGAPTTMKLIVDDAQVDAPVDIAGITDGARRFGIGLQSAANAGPRRLELDDVFVELVQ